MPESEELGVLDTIRDLKARDPFGPFRIVMTSGDKYQIDSGENLVEMKSQLLYVIPRSDRVIFMRLNQIARLKKTEPRGVPDRDDGGSDEDSMLQMGICPLFTPRQRLIGAIISAIFIIVGIVFILNGRRLMRKQFAGI